MKRSVIHGSNSWNGAVPPIFCCAGSRPTMVVGWTETCGNLCRPSAQVPGKKNTPLPVLLRTVSAMFRPQLVPMKSSWRSLPTLRTFFPAISRATSFSVYIDNKSLTGFLEEIVTRGCSPASCDGKCGHCRAWAEKRSVSIKLSGKRSLPKRR